MVTPNKGGIQMNIIDENFVEKSKKEKTKMSKIILIIIAILVIAIIGIIIALGYIDNAQLKVTVDGQLQEKVKDMLVFDGDTVYISIRDIASYVGYQSYSGDYAERSEAKNKCYIQNDDEIANFVLGSNKIYKLETQKTNSDYTYFYAKKPVKAINGKLYISSDGFQEAFNSSFIYNQDTNRIKIYTMNYLISSYQQTVLDKGFAEMSSEFHNEKSIFEERLVVQKDKKQLGVIDLKGNTIIEPKYEEITYIPDPKDRLKSRTEYLLEFENEALHLFQAILVIAEYLYKIKEFALIDKGHRPAELGMPSKKLKTGRNDLCPCGSGKKFKKCCLGKGLYD